jgi:uncharacterized protein (TIGR00255 family)
MESMTGYGRAEIQAEGIRILVEIRGLNNKGLDIPLHLPSALLRHDLACREKVRACVSRGRVEVRVTLELVGEQAVRISYSSGAARALGRLASELQEAGTLARGMTLGDLLSLPDAVRVGLAEDVEARSGETLLQALTTALEAFRNTRRAEGARLEKQFRDGASALEGHAERAASLIDKQVEAIRQRLGQKIQHLGVTMDPARLEQEVVVAAEKADVAEEVVRLQTHCKALSHLLLDDPGSQGKRLDHLLQEMQREVSTLLAKADLYELTQIGLEMRLLVEQLREQAQNVA